MNFFPGRLKAAHKAFSKKDLTERVMDEVRVCAKVHRGRGRPKKSIMGEGPHTVTLLFIQKVINAVIDDLDAKGVVLDQTANDLYAKMDERRALAGTIRSRMIAKNRESTKQGLFERAEDLIPELVAMGTTSAHKALGRKETWYIHRDSMLPMDLHVFADRALKKGRRENELNDKAAKAANMISEFLADGEMFEEGSVRYYEAIRNGDIVPGEEAE